MNMQQENANKNPFYAKLSDDQRKDIYNRYTFKKHSIQYLAREYKVNPKTITRTINLQKDRVKQNKLDKLQNTDIVDIEADNVSIAVIKEKYIDEKIKTQNAIHDAITEDIKQSRTVAQQSTNIAMQSLQKAISMLDHANPMAVASITASYEKIISAQQKHLTTLMKVGERYGIVDQTPKTPLVDQSTTTINNKQTGITIKIEEMARTQAIPEFVKHEDKSIAVDATVVE